jgi:hypothetical protein
MKAFLFALLILIFPSIGHAGPSGCNVSVDGYSYCKQDVNDYNGLTSAPSVSNIGSARIYYDNNLNTLECSQNGGSYTACIGSGSGSGNVGIGTNNYFPVYVTTTSLGPSNMVDVNGNVGINTAVPGTNLQVNGSLAVGGATIGYNDSYTAPTNGLLVSGNVGIGSTTPGQLLDVKGTVRMTGFQLGTSTTNGYVLTANSSGVGTWQAGTGGSGSNYWTLNGGSGNVGISTTGIPGSSSVGIGTTLGNGALEVMSGNVGIGTWNPQYPLQVSASEGSYGVPVNITNTSTSNGGNVLSLGSAQSDTTNQYDNPNISIQQQTNANNNYAVVNFADYKGNTVGIVGAQMTNQSTDTADLVFVTHTGSNFTEDMRVSSNTNIGIGTGIPAAGLYVAKASPTAVFTNNVGIGTGNPGQMLDVNGIVRATNMIDTGVTASNMVKTNGSQQLTSATGDTDYQNPISLTTTGTSGAATFSGDVLNIPQYSGGGGGSPGGSNGSVQYNSSGSFGGNGTFTYNGTNVGIGTNATTNTLNIMGNVGIGTTNGDNYLTHSAANGGVIVYGNVGIGTWVVGGNWATGSVINNLINYVENLNGESNGGQ